MDKRPGLRPCLVLKRMRLLEIYSRTAPRAALVTSLAYRAA